MPPCYWWSEEIKTLRAKWLQVQRSVQGSRRRFDLQELLFTFKQLGHDFRKTIKQSKIRSFKNLCNEADVNSWGTAYRVVMSKIKAKKSPQVTCPTILAPIVKALFL